ncbi:MAG: MBL fold metallo-hydrolase [Pirellulales bacterium]|nr:MBL fold metallo-hydrolase [Pirellulales bacterium]
MDGAKIDLKRIVSTPFEENTFIARLAQRDDCVVVDPGLEPEKTIRYLETQGLRPAAILVTHGHSDHIGGNGALKDRWPDCPLVIGSKEVSKLTDPKGNLSAMFGVGLVSPPADVTVDHGQTYSAAGLDFEVREIPGHSIGHVVFVVKDHCPPWVFVGDVIFSGSIGRTDFPDGDFHALAKGIREELFTLPDETVLLPGHGPKTTVGEEKRTNPFVGLQAGDSMGE